jgi:hypothetical protein
VQSLSGEAIELLESLLALCQALPEAASEARCINLHRDVECADDRGAVDAGGRRRRKRDPVKAFVVACVTLLRLRTPLPEIDRDENQQIARTTF